MTYNQEAAEVAEAERYKPILGDGMIRIIECHGERVGKDGRGLFE